VPTLLSHKNMYDFFKMHERSRQASAGGMRAMELGVGAAATSVAAKAANDAAAAAAAQEGKPAPPKVGLVGVAATNAAGKAARVEGQAAATAAFAAGAAPPALDPADWMGAICAASEDMPGAIAAVLAKEGIALRKKAEGDTRPPAKKGCYERLAACIKAELQKTAAGRELAPQYCDAAALRFKLKEQMSAWQNRSGATVVPPALKAAAVALGVAAW